MTYRVIAASTAFFLSLIPAGEVTINHVATLVGVVIVATLDFRQKQ